MTFKIVVTEIIPENRNVLTINSDINDKMNGKEINEYHLIHPPDLE